MKTLYTPKGQSVIEFAMLLVFVAIVILLALSFFGVSISDAFTNVNASI